MIMILKIAILCAWDNTFTIFPLGCPPGPPDPLTIGLGISGAIFIVGILLLVLWKILTMVYDNLEYSRFESEIKNPAWEKVSTQD